MVAENWIILAAGLSIQRPHKCIFSMSYDLQQRLEAFVSGECSLDVFLQELFVLCDALPESAWDVLSLVDQYYRRGKLSAELFLTVKNRIEQHVLGVPHSDNARELPDGPAGTESAVGATRGGTLTMEAAPERLASPQELVREIQALPIKLPNARRSVSRFRSRRAILADFGRRGRTALEPIQRELAVWGGRVRDHFVRLTSIERRRFLRQHIFPPCVVFGLLATVLVGIDSSPLPQDLPKEREVAEIVNVPAAAVVAPQIPEPGQISLSADRYVVFPGHTSAEIEVHRTAGVSGDVSFVWWTQRSAGARPTRDYVSKSPTIALLLDGVDTVHLSVPILANPSRKHTELFYVVIGKPGGGASLGSIRRAPVFIMGPG
jgi:hypothetical protein